MSSSPTDDESVLGELPTFDLEASAESTMAKQIDAFSSLAEDSRRHFNLESLRSSIEYLVECPFVGTPRRVGQNRSQGGVTTRRSLDVSANTSESETDVESISSISQMRALLVKWRRKCGKTRSETDYLNRLERFFKELQYQRRLARYFLQRIYVPLYKNFFNVNVLNEEESEDQDNAKTSNPDGEASAFFLTECAIIDGTSPTSDENQQISSIPERFQDVVQKLSSLYSRWTTLLRDETVFELKSFESSSASSVDSIANKVNNPYLILALRLLPDLFEKCTSAASLAIEWLGINENIPSERKVSTNDDGKEALLKSIRKAMMKKDSDIRRGEHSLNIHETELKQLNEREERVLALCHNCEELEAHREQIGGEYQEKIEGRVKMVEELENTIQGSQRFRDLSARLKSLESDINNQYGELKLVEYALNIAANDYDLHMNVQPSFYAYSRTTRDKIDRTRRELTKHRQDKEKLERKYERVTKQFEQMHMVVDQAMSETDSVKERPATNETYTRFRIDDRYSDKGQASDNSPNSGTDCGTESGHEADEEISEDIKHTKQSTGDSGRPKALASEFPFWPIHSGPGTLVNHSAPLGQ